MDIVWELFTSDSSELFLEIHVYVLHVFMVDQIVI